MLLAVLLAANPVPSGAATRSTQTAAPLYLVMDVSGSMEGERLTAAKAAAKSFIQRLQPDQIMALYTFPGGHKIVDGCSAGTFEIRPQRFSQGNAQAAIGDLRATGNTPTVPALTEVMRSVREQHYDFAQVVLVTDGEANCGSSNDVCSIVPLLTQQGINLRIHTVSLNNTPSGDASLACLAQATGGTSTNVDNLQDMIDAVRRSSSYAATLDVAVSATLPRVTGQAQELAPEMSVTVTGAGTAQIPDASLIVTFSGSATGQVDVRPSGLVPLGNVDPGIAVRRTLTLFPMATADGPITWTVTLASGGLPIETKSGTVQLTAGTTVATAGTILKDAKRVVVLGDSYSSGEGGGSYDGTYPFTEAVCHRSTNAYGRILFPEATMLACSGAVTADLTHSHRAPNSITGVEPQLYELLEVTASDNPPDLVLMTLGGNDSGFADVVTGFLTSATAADAPPVRPPLEWATLKSRLTTAYAHVNAVVNDPVAIARRAGKVAQIVVLLYPRPTPADGTDGCFALISSRELELANEFAASLNDTVRGAVAAAAADGVPVQVAGTVEWAFQPDHTICDGDDTHVNKISFDGVGQSAEAVFRALPASSRQELMHPNEAGYRAEAASLVEWSRTVTPKPLGRTPLDYDAIDVWMDSGNHGFWMSSTKLGDTGVTLTLPSLVTEPGQTVDVQLCLEECEFGSEYIIVSSYSAPIPLGSLPVAEDGRPRGTVVLPDELAPGTHTIVLRGYDEKGRPHEASFTVGVWRPGSNAGIYLAGLGGALLLVGAVMLVVARVTSPRNGRGGIT